MTKAMGVQCPATSKRSGQRCKRKVIGGGPCRVHGGAAPKVAAAREGRILAHQERTYFPVVERTPGEALLAAGKDADEVAQVLKARLASSDDPLALETYGQWVDRSGRWNRAIVEARVEDYLNEVRQRMGQQMAVAINRVFDRLGIFGDERVKASRYMAEELRRFDGARTVGEGS